MSFWTTTFSLVLIGGGGFGADYFNPNSPTDNKHMKNRGLYIASICFIIFGIFLLFYNINKLREEWKQGQPVGANGTQTLTHVPGSASNVRGVNPQGVPVPPPAQG